MSNIKIALFAIIVGLSGIVCIDFDDCGSISGKVTTTTVSECSSSADECQFKVGTNVTIDVQFLSETDSAVATVKVWGVFGSVPIPFPLNPSNACGNWNIKCPLNNGNNYELKITMPILSKYPKIELQVRVALIDSNGRKLVCQQFPVQIVD